MVLYFKRATLYLALGLLPASMSFAEGTMLDYFFKKVDVHLSPAVNGRITEDGKPVEGLKIVRQLAYNDFDPIKDVVYTDANGNFTFPEKNIRLPKRKISIQQNTTLQLIEVYHEIRHEKYILWDVSHIGIKENSQFTNKLNSLICDLNNPEVIFDFGKKFGVQQYYPYYGVTICRWQDDFSIRRINN